MKYFHTHTVIKCRQLRIETLKGDDGEWVDNEAHLRQLAVSHFSSLYGEDSARGACMTESRFPELSIKASAAFSVGVTIEEVRKVLFDMPPFRAPGPNGYEVVFYYTNWDIICHSLLDFVRCVFESGRSVAAMNSTLIALIPKVQVAKKIHQFHPKYIPSLILPYQSSFISGRHIYDNVIVARELIHFMKRMKRKKGFMALKIDLEKAYDRLSWDFLNATLSLAGILEGLIRIIKDYDSSPVMQKRVRKSHFQNVVAWIRNQLNGWSASSLSMASQTTLIKSIIQSIPSYTMQFILEPGEIRHGLAVTGGLSITILVGSLGLRLWAVVRAHCLRPISCNSTRADCKFCDIVWRLGLASDLNLFEQHIPPSLGECAAVLGYEWQLYSFLEAFIVRRLFGVLG
ncbi:hypothetical protein CRG98_030833 [Punica granatum]|uniref:Uncharacterized protein n=1 Tax=Punica granatum TaxID=22663 RepID=A0A2I0IXS3_PUNGR|nr:hypothetical protein CRG98_030833 [Punica granatum]